MYDSGVSGYRGPAVICSSPCQIVVSNKGALELHFTQFPRIYASLRAYVRAVYLRYVYSRPSRLPSNHLSYPLEQPSTSFIVYRIIFY